MHLANGPQQGPHLAAVGDGAQVVQRIVPGVLVHHRELGLRVRVADRHAGGEAVPLCLGQGVGALHLDRVLGGDHHERRAERVGLAVDGDLVLLHALQQRRLGLRRGPVDLVADDDVGEHRAGPELEGLGLAVVDGDPGDVAGQQVRGELDAADRAVDGPGQRLGQRGLADAGHVLDQQVAFGQHGDQRDPHHLRLADQHLLDVGGDALNGAVQSVDARRRRVGCERIGRRAGRRSAGQLGFRRHATSCVVRCAISGFGGVGSPERSRMQASKVCGRRAAAAVRAGVPGANQTIT